MKIVLVQADSSPPFVRYILPAFAAWTRGGVQVQMLVVSW